MDAVVVRSELAIRNGSKSFAMAARLLDRATRDDAVMLYAWCRYCDDVIDVQSYGHAPRASVLSAPADGPAQTNPSAQSQRPARAERLAQSQRLARLRRETDDALSGRPSSSAFEALRRVLERHCIPARYPHALLSGFQMDVAGRDYCRMSDTLDYCYHVAGVVGVMMAMIMGVRVAPGLDRASDLGIAFQLTNIARDVIDDARAGRVYFPRSLLLRHGIAVIDPNDGAQRHALHAAALELLDVAERYYASSQAGLAFLPARSAWAIAAARRIYRAIGERLRACGPAAWDSRIVTSDARKALLLACSLGDVARSRFGPEGVPREGLFQRPR